MRDREIRAPSGDVMIAPVFVCLVLNQYYRFVKVGVRGLGFVRTDPKIHWPDELTKLPQ